MLSTTVMSAQEWATTAMEDMTRMTKYFNKDCMQGMKQYPDKYFDLAIVDPPYGISMDKGTSGFGHAKVRNYKGGWDSESPTAEYFEELMRVSKNQIIWGGQYMTEHLKSGTKWLVWDKVGETEFQNPFSKCELAWTSFNGVVDKFVCRQMGFISDDKSKRIHPTQKPVALYKWILVNYAKEGDIILDTHVGSASSLIACEELGFDYVGFEIDEQYYQSSRQRMEERRAQISLLDIDHFSLLDVEERRDSI